MLYFFILVLKEIEMQVGYNEYRGYPVVVFPEFGEDKKAGFDRLMSTSGFACAVMDSATRKSTAEHFEDCPELIQAFDKVPDGYFILVEYELYQKLVEELGGTYAHHPASDIVAYSKHIMI
jgi:hypothetical protein